MNRNMAHAFDGYTPVSGDIVTSGYFKAGTNWVMHMCYQIAHLGEGHFAHIQDVIPWPDAAEPRYWLDLHDPTPYASPTGYRVIKSHLTAEDIPLTKAAKYIAVIRDPKDCAASAYHYFSALALGPTAPPPDLWLDFFGTDEAIFGRWDRFTASWYARREYPNVLFLRYEDMRADPVAVIKRIASFLGIDLAPQACDKVVALISFQAMKAMNARFYPVRQNLWSVPEGEIIRKGTVGDSALLFSPAALERLDQVIERGLASLGSDFPYRHTYVNEFSAHTIGET
ncbi:MAG: sulfotransferase domain-containing protein, partial [Desulfomonile tiedjei]|nr:sulfotransferase domain-containing protein [Desulfomonile tiedjei]